MIFFLAETQRRREFLTGLTGLNRIVMRKNLKSKISNLKFSVSAPLRLCEKKKAKEKILT